MLQDTKTYNKRKHDPTAKYKRELAALLKELRDRQAISNTLHKRLYPTSDQPPRFYGLPKTHKINMSLRPIVSTIGSITYETAKHLAEVLSPLVGQTEFHVKNSKKFAESITGINIIIIIIIIIIINIHPWTGTLSRWSSLSTFYRGT